MFRLVEFLSEGATVRGRLYMDPVSARPAPLVVMAHGLSSTISGMTIDKYAEVFHAAGLGVLLFDHRNFGLSDGEPRQHVNVWTQARGYRDAIRYAAALAEVDARRIAVWGVSLSAVVALVAAAVDPVVKALVVQVPAYGAEPPPPDPDGVLFAKLRETLLNGDVDNTPEATLGPIAVASNDQSQMPSLIEPLAAFRWLMEYGGPDGTGWQNVVTIAQPATPAPFDAGLCAPHLQAALLMLIAPQDEIDGANPRVARSVFDLAPGPKELHEIAGGHFGALYYPGDVFETASAIQRDFLLRHLA